MENSDFAIRLDTGCLHVCTRVNSNDPVQKIILNVIMPIPAIANCTLGSHRQHTSGALRHTRDTVLR